MEQMLIHVIDYRKLLFIKPVKRGMIALRKFYLIMIETIIAVIHMKIILSINPVQRDMKA